MTHDDPDITNGTCYYKAGGEADAAYSPAGNAALGHTFCCQLGDKLNSHNACVQEKIGHTYLAGCTDSTYTHPSCPYKANHSDYQWVGMVHCLDSDTNKLVTWVGCDNDGSVTPTKSDDSEGCACDLAADEPDQPLFRAGTGLDAWGHLPASKEDSIDWLARYPLATTIYSNLPASEQSSLPKTIPPSTTGASTTDSASVATTSPTTSTSNSATTTPSISSTSSPSASASSTSPTFGLSSASAGEKAGVGVGITAVSIFAICLVIWAVKSLRDRRRARNNKTEFGSAAEKPPSHMEPTIPDVGDPDLRSPAWSGHKSELPGSPANAAAADHHSLDNASTIVNSPSWSSVANVSPKHGSEQPFYRPFRYQPSTPLEGIQEMPDHERPRWAQTDYGTYGPNRGYPGEHDSITQPGNNAAHVGGKHDVHELPA